MATLFPESLQRAGRGLWKGSLDEHRDLIVLRVALFVLVVTAIVLIAVDPVVRGFASMAELRDTADPHLRERILTVWAKRGLLRSAYGYLWIDAVVFAPALLAFAVAFLRFYDNRVRADGELSAPFAIRWTWVRIVPALAFVAHEACIGFGLWAVTLASDPRTALPGWLHVAIHGSYRAALLLYAAAAIAGLFLFSQWFFATSPSGAGNDDAAPLATDRSRLRGAIADIVWRSKYALGVLVVFAALVLVMDQTRDALLRQIIDFADDATGLGWGRNLLGLALTLAAVALLARASWLWPRLILRLRSPDAPPKPPPGAEAFAKWWCRILGLAPYVIVAVMIANTFHDLPGHDPAVGWFAFALAVILVLAAVFLLRVSLRVPVGSASIGYYERADDGERAREDMPLLPLLVGWGAPILFLLARTAGLLEWTPPLALAVIAAALATWAGVLGWVAYESRRFAVPYLLVLVGWVGIAAFADWTNAHRIRDLGDGVPSLDQPMLQTLFATTAILLALCIGLAWVWKRRSISGLARVVSLAVVTVAVLIVIGYRDRHVHESPAGSPLDAAATVPGGCPAASDSADGKPASSFCDRRATLDDAVKNWVAGLPAEAFAEADHPDPAKSYPVFLVTTEGGGIRSAYWTAKVLSRLKAGVPDFERRTFALSGVSGGALGLAVYRACSEQGGEIDTCIELFGSADLWTQLLGGLFFEDALAAVVPTAWCRLPGCGALGRSYWFEGAMERSVPALAQGVAGAAHGGKHVPHLFLNATRVETGERVIASDVRIGPADFPTAHDLIATINADVRLSTAAHNSSRFPYTNPVGAVYGPGCPEDPRQSRQTGGTAGGGSMRGASASALCMRLQDGGYLDNSGALTANDLLRALETRLDAYRCVRARDVSEAHDVSGAPRDARVAGPCNERIAWVRPIVLEIRNNYTAAVAPDESAPAPCANATGTPMNPLLAELAPPLALYPSLITAAVTTLTTRTAHMRNFEGELERRLAASWQTLGIALPAGEPAHCAPNVAEWIGTSPVHRFDLIAGDRLYPQGWMLSDRARKGMTERAECSVPYPPYASCMPAEARKR